MFLNKWFILLLKILYLPHNFGGLWPSNFYFILSRNNLTWPRTSTLSSFLNESSIVVLRKKIIGTLLWAFLDNLYLTQRILEATRHPSYLIIRKQPILLLSFLFNFHVALLSFSVLVYFIYYINTPCPKLC